MEDGVNRLSFIKDVEIIDGKAYTNIFNTKQWNWKMELKVWVGLEVLGQV